MADGGARNFICKSQPRSNVTRTFISQDGIGFAGGDTILYRYMGNSTINATDPSGHIAETVWNAASLGIGLAGLWHSISTGNVMGTTIDMFGIAVDDGVARDRGMAVELLTLFVVPVLYAGYMEFKMNLGLEDLRWESR